MATLYTTAEAAALLGVTASRVRYLAPARNVGTHHGRAWLFTAADIEAMRERPPGWPRGKPRKPTATE